MATLTARLSVPIGVPEAWTFLRQWMLHVKYFVSFTTSKEKYLPTAMFDNNESVKTANVSFDTYFNDLI
jgi:hypothetical protein